MNNPNRDLLILFNQELMTPQALQHEVDMLHELLYEVERVDNLAIAHEVLDINKHKLIKKQHELRGIIRQRTIKAFVFLNCKN